MNPWLLGMKLFAALTFPWVAYKLVRAIRTGRILSGGIPVEWQANPGLFIFSAVIHVVALVCLAWFVLFR
ncbi:hypothetical protein FW784_14175 [Lysobacter lacus]|uniref:Uncharacterized protein n=1 Tax=Cognatilysobacter lacus TaxID=1643323 RepID=A0A5D8YB83_9GAMM|nr:hypothetical protein FW784_14175 [Lysobacter lacus]